jgi:hypothetical protein
MSFISVCVVNDHGSSLRRNTSSTGRTNPSARAGYYNGLAIENSHLTTSVMPITNYIKIGPVPYPDDRTNIASQQARSDQLYAPV